jgi:hypothetical protein
MTLDLSFHNDLARTDVIRAIMDYGVRATTNERQNATLISDNKVEPPVQSIMVALTGDGSPAESSHRINDADKSSGENKYNPIRFFPGDFHFALEFHRMRGRFFDEDFGYFVSKWRTTPGKQKWILEPLDPNDLEDELYEYMLAHYRCAVDCLAEIKGSTLSPAQINEHMLEGASNFPIHCWLLSHKKNSIDYFK